MELTFEITNYQVDAMFDDFDDGTSQIFDVATVRVLSGDLTGRTYHVYVLSGTPEVELWRQTGSTLSAEVNPDDLKSDDILFSGAFTLGEGR